VPDLAVVILHFRNWPDVRATVDAVLAEGVPRSDVLVIDNASNDGSDMHLRDAFPDLDVRVLPSNGGYAAGMNAALRIVGDRDVLLLTHETVLCPGSIAALTSELIRDPGAGIVGPLLAYRNDPDVVFSAGGEFDAHLTTNHRAAGRAVDACRGDSPVAVDWLDGACLLVRRECRADVGEFDEGFFLYFEETDYCCRARARGWTLKCVPAALALQQPGEAPRALWVRNQLRFLRRHAGFTSFARQVAIDVVDLVRGPQRAATAHGLLGAALGTDPRKLASSPGRIR
jgi:GT2 family glycosyltransferase